MHAKHPEIAARWDAEIRARRKVKKMDEISKVKVPPKLKLAGLRLKRGYVQAGDKKRNISDPAYVAGAAARKLKTPAILTGVGGTAYAGGRGHEKRKEANLWKGDVSKARAKAFPLVSIPKRKPHIPNMPPPSVSSTTTTSGAHGGGRHSKGTKADVVSRLVEAAGGKVTTTRVTPTGSTRPIRVEEFRQGGYVFKPRTKTTEFGGPGNRAGRRKVTVTEGGLTREAKAIAGGLGVGGAGGFEIDRRHRKRAAVKKNYEELEKAFGFSRLMSSPMAGKAVNAGVGGASKFKTNFGGFGAGLKRGLGGQQGPATSLGGARGQRVGGSLLANRKTIGIGAAAAGTGAGAGMAMNNRQRQFGKADKHSNRGWAGAGLSGAGSIVAGPIGGLAAPATYGAVKAKKGRKAAVTGRIAGRSFTESTLGGIGGALAGAATRNPTATTVGAVGGSLGGQLHGAYRATKNASRRGDLKKSDGLSAFGIEH